MILKALIDAGGIILSFILAYYLRFKVMLFLAPQSLPIFERYFNTLAFVVIVWLAINKLIGLYDNKKFTALVDELALLFFSVSVSSLVLVGFLFLYRELWFSRLVVLNAWWISFLLLALSRIALAGGQRLLRACGRGVKNTLVLGAGEMGETLVAKLLLDRGLGYRVVGYLDDDPAKQKQCIRGVPVLGTLAAVRDIIPRERINEVLIASAKIPADKVLDIITECERFGVEFKIVPGILELIASRVDVDEIAGVPLLTVSEIRLQGLNAAVKRSVDLLASGLGLLLLSPLLGAVALLVKLTSPGPVLYAQERVGLDGRTFPMYKFRSMIKDADKMIDQLADRSEVAGHIFKMKNDPRLTPPGRFLRRFSIDELPQLINVLFGQMSLVGPRPPLPREVAKYNAWHRKRLRVRPGITGLWQVSGRSHLPFEDMVRLDIYYIENWSLWQDLKILLRTIPVTLTGSGAY
jgi:exopolysaccharide biosynthesis polyprenyl glycosylphosphotransferase